MNTSRSCLRACLSSVLLLLITSGVTLTTVGTPSTASASASSRVCVADHVTIALKPVTSKMGHVGYLIELTNAGPGACQVAGYLKVTLEQPTENGLAQGPTTVAARDTMHGYLGGLARNSSSRRLPVITMTRFIGASALVEGTDVVTSSTTCTSYSTLVVTGFNFEPGFKAGFPVKFPDCTPPLLHPLVTGPSGSS